MFKKDKYYTIKEVSEKANVEIHWLYTKLHRNQYPVRMIGGLYHVTGDVARKLIIKERKGPKNTKVNLVK